MKTLKQYLDDNGYMMSVEQAREIASLVCTWEADNLELNEPHATTDINALRNASDTIVLGGE